MKILVALLFSVASYGAVCAGTNGFAHCQSFTVDHTKVPGNLTNYPALVCFDASMGANCLTNSKQLATVTNGGSLLDTINGFDFVFTSDAGCTVTLNYEVKFHNLTTGPAEIWVNLPTVSSTVDTTIYMCFGKVSITTDQSNVAGTWDANFVAVYHFDFLTGANTTVNDTKGNASFISSDLFNNATPGAAGSGVTGIAGGAVSLLNFGQGGFSDGGHAYSGFPTGSNPRTLECWLQIGGAAGTQRGAMSWGATGVGVGWSLSFATVSGMEYWGAYASNTDQAFAGRLATGSVNDNKFHHIAIVLPSGGTTFNDTKTYIDGATGANDANIAGTTTINSTSVQVVLACGVRCNGDWLPSAFAMTALMDECRISNIERSAAWLGTEFNNVNNPSSFFERSVGPGGSKGRTIIIN